MEHPIRGADSNLHWYKNHRDVRESNHPDEIEKLNECEKLENESLYR
jgi:hypothetical protein